MGSSPLKWYREYLTPELVLHSGLKHVFYRGHTRYQRVEIIETGPFGRCLVLDGKTQSSELDEFVYHESLVHPAMITHPYPVSVLIVGGGEGATLREVLSHNTVKRVVMVDLDKEVVDLCKRYLPRHHQGAFDDPRLELHHADALRFLEQTQDVFDIMVMDGPDPLEGGPAYLLYTQEFYRLAQEHLNPGGLVVVQAGACDPIFHREVFTAVHKTLSTVFAQLLPYRAYMPSFGSMWGFVLASQGPNAREFTANDVDSRIASRVSRVLSYYDGETHGSFLHLPKYIRQALMEEQRIITRDSPVFAT